ncbi:MAG: membrane protein insertion efficiency factor YidD [Clostridia bacterium]
MIETIIFGVFKIFRYILNQVFILLIMVYRKFISPLKRPCCRFYPTCSRYALDAVTKYGFLKGGYLSIKRLLRCNPFNAGGYDPVK